MQSDFVFIIERKMNVILQAYVSYSFNIDGL